MYDAERHNSRIERKKKTFDIRESKNLSRVNFTIITDAVYLVEVISGCFIFGKFDESDNGLSLSLSAPSFRVSA